MPVISTHGDKIDVFQFLVYSVSIDEMKKSRRYGTERAIKETVMGKILFESKREVDRSIVEFPNTDILGLTSIGFNPDISS